MEGGLEGILLRERELSDKEFGALLENVLRMFASIGGWVGVHDRAHFAVPGGTGTGPSGLHLGFRSLPLQAARRVVGKDLAIGLSVHASDDPRSWEQADYVFFGPVRATPSKRGILPPTGFRALGSAVRRAHAHGETPLWAIGGLEPADAGRVRKLGAAGLGALRGVLQTRDPARAAERYCAGWNAGES